MVVHSKTGVTQEAQDYLKQFKGSRARGPRKNGPDSTFEAMLDTWTREKFQGRNGDKKSSSASAAASTSSRGTTHHRHVTQNGGGDGWDGMSGLFTNTLPSNTGTPQYPGVTEMDVGMEGELFAEAELEEEQETYMNEEALLEQLLQEEPLRKSSKKGRPDRHKPSSRNEHRKRQQPKHSTPKGVSHESPYQLQHYDAILDDNMLDNHHANASSPRRGSRRGNPPPPPPRTAKADEAEIDSRLPSCHNCGWTYTIAQNEVLDLPELLDILTPKSSRKHALVSSSHVEYLIDENIEPPPLPSKPRPPPPASFQQQQSLENRLQPHLRPNQPHSQLPHEIPPHFAAAHSNSKELAQIPEDLIPQDLPLHVHPASNAMDYFSQDQQQILPRSRSSSLTSSPKHFQQSRSPPKLSPKSSTFQLPLSKSSPSSSRGTQTDPNLLSQDLSPLAMVEKEKSSDTDTAKGVKERSVTRAKPPSGRRARHDSLNSTDEQHPLREQEPILDAAKQGNIERMMQMIHDDPEQLKHRDIQGNNLMHICCERGHLTCVQYLYQHFSYQLEEENKSKFTPAVLTIKGGQSEVLEWLLERTDARDEILPLPNKKSLLHHAAKFGQDNCLRIVLDKLSTMGRLTACCDGNGNSPAHVAAKHGHLACLQTLVEYGLDVTKANKYGHSPCYYADFSNHRQCAGYLMVVETCLNLAKKLIRLERSMEQLSSSLAKYSGEGSQGDLHLTYDYGGDKSSATSSVEDDGTRDEAWQLLCRKFEEASKRLVVFRTQNRAIRPLRPTKLAMLALAQSKEDTQAAFSVLDGGDPRISGSKSLDNSLDGTNHEAPQGSRSQSFPDLLKVQSGEGGKPLGFHNKPSGSGFVAMATMRSTTPPRQIHKHHRSQPDLTTSDESNYFQSVNMDSANRQNSLPSSMTYAQTDNPLAFFHSQQGILSDFPQGARPKRGAISLSNQLRESPTTEQSWSNSVDGSAKSNDRFDNDLEYHLQTRVFTSKMSSFRPEKYLIQNRPPINEPPLPSNDAFLQFQHRSVPPRHRHFSEIPPPPLENETSDFFEDANDHRDSDTSELDPETLKKIFDMQEEIMLCHPQKDELARSRVQTPVKIKLTAQDFKESYARPNENENENENESHIGNEPSILRRYRGMIRMRHQQQSERSSDRKLSSSVSLHHRSQNPSMNPTDPSPVLDLESPSFHHEHVDSRALGSNHDVIDLMNKSGNNSHTDSLDTSLQQADDLRHDEEILAGNNGGTGDDGLLQPTQQHLPQSELSRPWYEMTDEEDTKQSTEKPEEYFTLL